MRSRNITAQLVGAFGFTILVVGLAEGQAPSVPEPALVTDVIVDVWPEPGVPPRRYTLQCNPPRGTVPQPAAACARIDALIGPGMRGRPPQPAPPPPPTVLESMPPPLPPRRDGELFCTQIYGGPEVARIRGLIGGMSVNGVIGRRDGCEIGGYDRNMDLLGVP